MTADVELDRERLLQAGEDRGQDPSLQARSQAQQRTGEQAVTELMAEWLAVDPATDPRPAIVAAATLAVVRVTFNSWLARGGEGDLPKLVAEALDLLDGGLQNCVAPPAKTSPRRHAASA